MLIHLLRMQVVWLEYEAYPGSDDKNVRFVCMSTGAVGLREALSCWEAKPEAISTELSRPKIASFHLLEIMLDNNPSMHQS